MLKKNETSPQWQWIFALTIWSVLFLLPFFWSKGLGVVSKTFMEGSQRFWENGNPYATPEIGDVFHYSPLFAALYGIFAYLPPLLHLIFWATLNSFVFFLALNHWIRFEKKMNPWIWLALAACLMELDISQRYHQANALIIGLIILGIALYRDRKFLGAGIVFALGIDFKIIPALFALPLLWPLHKRYILGLFAGFILFFLAPALFCGWERNLYLHQSQFQALFSDLNHRAMLDIKSVLIRNGYEGIAETVQKTLLILSLILFCGSRFIFTKDFPWARWITFGTATCLLLSPRTESPTFVLLAPAYLLMAKDGTRIERTITSISFFLISIVFTAVWDPFFHLSIQNNYVSKVMGTSLIWILTAVSLTLLASRTPFKILPTSKLSKMLLLLLFLPVFLLLTPFALALAFTSQNTADYYLKQLSYKRISDRVVEGLQTDKQKAEALFHFLEEHITAPWEYGHPDIYPFYDLIMGMGHCDQQANTFITLLRKQKIKANLVFLYKDDLGASSHTVAEVFAEGKWQVFDPYSGAYNFHIGNSEPLSISEMHDLVNQGKGDQISSTNGRLLPKDFEQYRGTDLERYFQAKSYYLFGRNEQAEKIFKKLSQDAISDKYYEVMLLWRTANLIQMENFIEAEKTLNTLDNATQRILATRMFAKYFWGLSQLNQGKLDIAETSLLRIYSRAEEYFRLSAPIASSKFAKQQIETTETLRKLTEKTARKKYLIEAFAKSKTLIDQVSPVAFSQNSPQIQSLLHALERSEENGKHEEVSLISHTLIDNITGRVSSNVLSRFRKLATLH